MRRKREWAGMHVNLRPDDYAAIEALADVEETTLSELVRRLLHEALAAREAR